MKQEWDWKTTGELLRAGALSYTKAVEQMYKTTFSTSITLEGLRNLMKHLGIPHRLFLQNHQWVEDSPITFL